MRTYLLGGERIEQEQKDPPFGVRRARWFFQIRFLASLENSMYCEDSYLIRDSFHSLTHPDFPSLPSCLLKVLVAYPMGCAENSCASWFNLWMGAVAYWVIALRFAAKSRNRSCVRIFHAGIPCVCWSRTVVRLLNCRTFFVPICQAKDGYHANMDRECYQTESTNRRSVARRTVFTSLTACSLRLDSERRDAH